MADTLLDMLRRKRSGSSDPGAAAPFTPPGSSTADLTQHISEASGRGTSQPAPVSSAPEAVAAADARDTMAGVRDTAAARGAGEDVAAAGIADASTRVGRETAEKAASISAAAKRQADTALSEYENGRFGMKALGGEKDRAAAEQLAMNIRLGNDRYINDLTNAATRDMINSEADFTQAFYNREFADSASLFGDAQSFRQIMAMDQADFAKQMANTDMDQVLAGYKKMVETRKAQAPYAMGGAAMSSAAQYASSSKESKSWGSDNETPNGAPEGNPQSHEEAP